MEPTKQRKLEEAGWKIGSTEEFLNLTPEEAAYINLKIALGNSVRQTRAHKKMTQSELAALLRSSQSRVAKMEAGDPSVSLDLLIRSLLSLGLSRENLALLIAA